MRCRGLDKHPYYVEEGLRYVKSWLYSENGILLATEALNRWASKKAKIGPTGPE